MKLSKKSNLAILLMVVLCVLLFMFLGRASKNKPLESSIRSTTNPIAGFFSGMGAWADDKFSFFTEIGVLKKENKILFEDNIILKGKIAMLEDIEKENDELRNQINLAPREEYSLISALVVGKDLKDQGEMIHLNKGKKDGVKEQMAVIVGEGIFIGKISEVFERSCNVELLINRNSKINGEIIGSGAKGIARGQFGTSIVLDMIPQAVKIEHGDTVITSGVGGLLPRGLLIGYTQDTTPTSDQLFQKTSLILPSNLDKLRVVWIVDEEK